MQIKLTILILIIAFLMQLGKTPALAASLYFEEDFNILNNSQWEILGSASGASVDSGELKITPPQGITSSYVRSKLNPFPESGDFSFEMKFRFPQLTYAGIGFVLGDSNPDFPVDINDPVNSRILTVWQDLATPLLGLHNSDIRYNFSPNITTSSHLYKVEYINSYYKVSLDNQIVYTSTIPDRRPKAIWFGNPGPAVSSQNWTNLFIDYIKINKISEGSSLTISSPYDSLNKQVPIDRSLQITANLRDANDQPIVDATVSAQVIDGSKGALVSTTAKTINNGDAYFTFNPNTSTGNVQIKFTYQDIIENYSFTLYRPPVVIVPGMGASMNTKKFYSDDNNQTDWGWSPTANAGWNQVISSLVANGYEQDSSFAIAFYDWRKSLNKNSYNNFEVEAVYKNLKPQINKLLENVPNGRKVNILAHSFGGLVTRTMIQNDWDDGKVNKFLTFGTPHHGASASYYIWNGGEMPPTGDAMFRFVMGTLLKIHKYHYGLPEMSAIRNTFTGVQQLLPTYSNYAYRYGGPLSTNSLTFKNDILIDSVSTQDFINDINSKNISFTSFYGTGEKTLRDIKLSANVGIDIWPDGVPEKNPSLVDGDDSVLPESAKISNLISQSIVSNHADLPDNSLSQISSALKLNLSNQFNLTSPRTMLGAVVLSPARPQIFNDLGEQVSTADSFGNYPAQMEIASDLPDGNYTVRVIGTGTGNYVVYIPFAGATKWDELVFNGTTTRGEIDDYPIYLSNAVEGSSISTIAQTTMSWQLGTINFVRKLVPIEYVLKLPDNFDTNQLQLGRVQFNKSQLNVLSYKVDKKGKKLHITLNGRDVAQAINWRESEEQVKMMVAGEDTSLSALLKLRIPWGLYRKYMYGFWYNWWMNDRSIIFISDNIRSLENVGSLFRIADGMGAQAVWSVGISGYPDLGEQDTRRPWLKERNTKFIQKSGLSGLQTVSAAYFSTPEEAIARLKSEGYQIICVEQTEKSVDFRSTYSISAKCAIVMGNEIDGVGKAFLNAADLVLEIPMKGAGKSLNVSVSAGIIAYEVANRPV